MKKIKKYLFIILVIALAVIIIEYLGQQNKTEKKELSYPNVVFIVLDTLRNDKISEETSPWLYNFAQENIYFPHLIANGSWTLPNTVTMLTGLHPEEHQMDHENINTKIDHLWLAEILKEHNYTTAGFSANRNIKKRFNFDEGLDEFQFPKEKIFKPGEPENYPDQTKIYEASNAWLDQYNNEQPYYLYLHLMNIHGPYRCAQEIRDQFSDETAGTFEYYGETMTKIMRENDPSAHQQVTPEYVQDLNNHYAAAIYYTDQALAEFMQRLKDEDIYDDTLIVIVADHGEELYDHQGFSHGYSLYQEIIDTFMIIKPAKNTAEEIKKMRGINYPDFIQQLDVLPTMLTALNIDIPENLIGQNIFARDSYETPTIITKADYKRRMTGHALTEWPYKLIYTKKNYQGKDNQVELYNLAEDPYEQKDLAEIETDIKTELWEKLLNRN